MDDLLLKSGVDWIVLVASRDEEDRSLRLPSSS
jgi:hypothetical protein